MSSVSTFSCWSRGLSLRNTEITVEGERNGDNQLIKLKQFMSLARKLPLLIWVYTVNFLTNESLGWIPALKRLHMNPILVHSSLLMNFLDGSVDVLIMVTPLFIWYLTDIDVMWFSELFWTRKWPWRNDQNVMHVITSPTSTVKSGRWHWCLFSPAWITLLSQRPFQTY